MVSGSATSKQLLDYGGFYRTVAGETTAATALVKLATALAFPYVQVGGHWSSLPFVV